MQSIAQWNKLDVALCFYIVFVQAFINVILWHPSLWLKVESVTPSCRVEHISHVQGTPDHVQAALVLCRVFS